MLASEDGHIELIDKLLQHGASVDLQNKVSCSSSNHFALQLLHQDGLSSLMVASCSGHVEVVDKLLQHGASVDLQDQVELHLLCKTSIFATIITQDGWNSLIFASYNGHVKVVDKLLQHGASVDLQNKVQTYFTFSYIAYIHNRGVIVL